VIYVCTVHHETEKWIAPQTRFLHKYLKSPSRVLACVPQVQARPQFHVEIVFEPASRASQNHADKLNHLAGIAIAEGASDDVLVFLDGDAFPIAPLDSFLERQLAEFPLVAVQRLENDGDKQPHPSFAATTVGFWRDIAGDWSPGHCWLDSFGNSVTDTGGNLLARLDRDKIPWHPMRRTNRRNLHELWFGIYDDLVYHHGAGYRAPVSRFDENRKPGQGRFEGSDDYHDNRRLHSEVFDLLVKDDDFHRNLGLS